MWVKYLILNDESNFHFFLCFFSVPPSKPKIILQPDNGMVEGYLGPYQIGTRLSLSCQVFGGEIHTLF